MASIVYKGEKYDIALERCTAREAMEIERVSGWTFLECMAKQREGSMLAISAVAFVAVKREMPALRFDEFDFELDSLQHDETDGGQVPDPTAAEEAPEASDVSEASESST